MVAKGKGKGGFIGGMIESIGQIFYCICCMLVLGPILVIIGIAIFSSSFADTRMTGITKYDQAVDKWNSGPDANTKFQNLEIFAEFKLALSISTPQTKILLGATAPEPLGDEALRKEETFTTIKSPFVSSATPPFKAVNSFVFPNFFFFPFFDSVLFDRRSRQND